MSVNGEPLQTLCVQSAFNRFVSPQRKPAYNTTASIAEKADDQTMKGKMDGVARRAEGVAQRFLPERPHHLCIDAKRRFPNPTGFWYSGQSAGLQYMTYLSDADRGVLLTLPFFEIRDEPDTLKPPPNTAARGEAKKKMTFKDYQNRKKSNSPTDNDASSTKPDSQQAAATAPRESAKNEEQNSRGLTRPEKSRQEAPYEK